LALSNQERWDAIGICTHGKYDKYCAKLAEKSDEKRSFGRFWHREEILKWIIQKILVDLVHLVQEWDQGWALVNSVIRKF
jgi:hypothetical protein